MIFKGVKDDFLRALGPCAAVALSLVACQDASHDPMAVIVTEETRSTLLVHSELPALPDLAARAGVESRMTGAMDAWIGSWEREDPEEARRLRSDAYGSAARPLADRLGAEGVRTAHADLGHALEGIRSLDGGSLEPDMQARIQRATELHERASEALQGGARREALARTMEGADLLREMAPESVARLLIARAEGALEVYSGEMNGDEIEVERGTRMLDGARLALEDGDAHRALQRAFYACQLLNVLPR